jgi:hypothetical protein
MASPKKRKPPEGGSAKGTVEAPAGSVQVAAGGVVYEKTGTLGPGMAAPSTAAPPPPPRLARSRKPRPQPHARTPRRRNVRTGTRKARAPGSQEGSEPDLDRSPGGVPR